MDNNSLELNENMPKTHSHCDSNDLFINDMSSDEGNALSDEVNHNENKRVNTDSNEDVAEESAEVSLSDSDDVEFETSSSASDDNDGKRNKRSSVIHQDVSRKKHDIVING